MSNGAPQQSERSQGDVATEYGWVPSRGGRHRGNALTLGGPSGIGRGNLFTNRGRKESLKVRDEESNLGGRGGKGKARKNMERGTGKGRGKREPKKEKKARSAHKTEKGTLSL